MNIEKMTISSQPLEKKEKILFDLIDRIDKESFNLFSEITDLSQESFYKIDFLLKNCKELQLLLKSTSIAFNDLYKMQEESYIYAQSRFRLKTLLVLITSMFISQINVLMCLFNWLVLTKTAVMSYTDELNYIGENIDNFDEEKLKRIEVTLDNCIRLLNGKVNRSYDEKELFKEKNYLYNVISANQYIAAFLDEKLFDEDTMFIPKPIKKNMISILMKDLNTDIDDIKELLRMAKDKKNNELKLIKDFIK